MPRPIAIAIAVTLCSVSGSASVYAEGGVLRTIEKGPTIRNFFLKEFYSIENGKLILANPIQFTLPGGSFKQSEFDLKGWWKPIWPAAATAYVCHHWKTLCGSES